MSRGPGQIQEWILAELERYGELQVNELCWFIALREGRVSLKEGADGLYSGSLSTPFYQSFGRAVHRLHDSGKVKHQERKLRSLDELVRYYPYKTSDGWLTSLRVRLLPFAKRFAERSGRKYSTADNEWHLRSQAPNDAPQRWRHVETQLFGLIEDLNSLPEPELSHRRGLVLRALAKGQSLFVSESDVSCNASLGTIVSEMVDLPPISVRERTTYTSLMDFYNDCFPPDDVARLDLKTRLYAVADFQRSGASRLTDRFKLELLHQAPHLLEAMPGHVPAVPEEVLQQMDWMEREVRRRVGVTFSHMLDKLIQRDAIGPFTFIQRPSRSTVTVRARR